MKEIPALNHFLFDSLSALHTNQGHYIVLPTFIYHCSRLARVLNTVVMVTLIRLLCRTLPLLKIKLWSTTFSLQKISPSPPWENSFTTLMTLFLIMSQHLLKNSQTFSPISLRMTFKSWYNSWQNLHHYCCCNKNGSIGMINCIMLQNLSCFAYQNLGFCLNIFYH